MTTGNVHWKSVKRGADQKYEKHLKNDCCYKFNGFDIWHVRFFVKLDNIFKVLLFHKLVKKRKNHTVIWKHFPVPMPSPWHHWILWQPELRWQRSVDCNQQIMLKYINFWSLCFDSIQIEWHFNCVIPISQSRAYINRAQKKWTGPFINETHLI